MVISVLFFFFPWRPSPLQTKARNLKLTKNKKKNSKEGLEDLTMSLITTSTKMQAPTMLKHTQALPFPTINVNLYYPTAKRKAILISTSHHSIHRVFIPKVLSKVIPHKRVWLAFFPGKYMLGIPFQVSQQSDWSTQPECGEQVEPEMAFQQVSFLNTSGQEGTAGTFGIILKAWDPGFSMLKWSE